MPWAAAAEWGIFAGLSAIAVATAVGMLLTMSMYRAGLALMSCFVALAGLFILLDADLLAAVQVMMNVGGMVVMILFMVMLMMDPGGEMMWEMKRRMGLRGPGALSMTMPRTQAHAPPEPAHDHEHGAAHPAERADAELDGRQQGPAHDHEHGAAHGDHNARSHAGDRPPATHESHERHATPEPPERHAMPTEQHHRMMVEMAMSTAQLPWALAAGAVSAVALIVLAVGTPWPLASVGPSRDAPLGVGELLLSRYMIGFEGAAMLILAGIAGAVLLGKREGLPPQARAVIPEAGKLPQGPRYTCPMHPEVQQDGPGTCPKCGMALVPAALPADSGEPPALRHQTGENGSGVSPAPPASSGERLA